MPEQDQRSAVSSRSKSNLFSLSTFLSIALWFGVAAGFIEGAGLLLFQRINWARWGPVPHVSGWIFVVSGVVDSAFFLILALLIWLISRFLGRHHATDILVFLLTFLSALDWLILTERLDRRACFVLALGVAVAVRRWFQTRQTKMVAYWRRSWRWAITALLLIFAGSLAVKPLRERRILAELPPGTPAPNVLLIVIDTLRADHLSSYGYSSSTSPNIDHIAKDGVLFENAISPSSWSLPSHASLITGRYVSEHGVGNVRPDLIGEGSPANFRGFLSLPGAMNQYGYRSAAISANLVYFTSNLGFGQKFSRFDDYFFALNEAFLRTTLGREFSRVFFFRTDKSKMKRLYRSLGLESRFSKASLQKPAGTVNSQTLTWLDQTSRRPFFLFLNYIDVHEHSGPGSAEYDQKIKMVDTAIGDLMHQLDLRGLASNTLLIITSDHGESLGQHGLTYHGASLYRELVHVPLIFWWPGKIPAGTRIAVPVTNSALPATIISLIGKGSMPTFRGPALDQLWRNTGSDSAWMPPISEVPQTDVLEIEDRAPTVRVPTSLTGDMKSIITPQWHLIVHAKSGPQLYDWQADVREEHDLSRSAEGAAIVLRLEEELREGVSGSAGAGPGGSPMR